MNSKELAKVQTAAARLRTMAHAVEAGEYDADYGTQPAELRAVAELLEEVTR
jgi:hypothetical protein